MRVERDPHGERYWRMGLSDHLFNNRGVRGITDTGLFYRPGDSKIRSLTNEGKSLTYSFWISPKGQFAVIPSDGYSPKTAAEIADALVQAMLDETS